MKEEIFRCCKSHNNAMNTDNRKLRSFVASLSAAGYGER